MFLTTLVFPKNHSCVHRSAFFGECMTADAWDWPPALHTASVAASAAACSVRSCRPPSRAPARVACRAAQAAARAVPFPSPRLTACPTRRAVLCMNSTGLSLRQQAFFGVSFAAFDPNDLRCALPSMLLLLRGRHVRLASLLLSSPGVPRASLVLTLPCFDFSRPQSERVPRTH